MSVQFTCPGCQSLLGASDDQANSIVRCPSCRNTFQLSGGSPLTAAPVHGRFPSDDELVQSERPSPTAPGRPLWNDPIVVIGAAVPTLIIVAFFVYLVWARTTANAPTMGTPKPELIEPGRFDPAAFTLVGKPAENLKPQLAEPPPPPDTTPAVAPQRVPEAVTVIQAQLSPQPENRAGPPGENLGAHLEPMFDLRGPAPKIGFKVREHTRVSGTKTSTLSGTRMKTFSERSQLVDETENIYTVTNVVNDVVCEYETKVITGDITMAVVDATGRKRTSEQLDNFVGETLHSSKLRGGWRHALLDELPTAKEQLALVRLRPFFQDRDSIPSNGQKLGATWDVDRDYIDFLVRTNMRTVSGKVKATFVKLVEYKGETCALIEYNGKIRGGVEFEENQERVCSISIALTTFRSMRNSIDAKTSGEIIIRSSDSTTIQGREAEVTTIARLAINSTVTVEK